MTLSTKWIGRGIWSLLTRVSLVGFGLINVSVLARVLTKQEFGAWVLYLSIVSVIDVMKLGFIKNPFITSWVKASNEQRPEILGSSLLLNLSISLLFSLFLCGVAKPLSSFWQETSLESLFYIFAIHNIVSIPLFYFESLQTLKLRFDGILVANVLRNGSLTAFLTYILVTGNLPSLSHFALVQIAGTLLAAVVSSFYVGEFLRIKPLVNFGLLSRLFHFGKYTFGTNISSMFIKSTDSWMLGKVASPAAVAVYNPAIRLSNLFEIPTMAIAEMIFPQVAQKMKHQGKKGVKDLYEKSVSLMLALILPIVLPMFIYAEEIMSLIFGAAYTDSASILRITIFYSLIIPFNRQFGTVMDGLQKPKINFLFLVFTACLNVILNYTLFHFMGIIGCAWGTLISFSIVFLMNQIILHKTFRISFVNVMLMTPTWYGYGLNMVFIRAKRLAALAR